MTPNINEQELKTKLFKTRESGWLKVTEHEKSVIDCFSADYMDFLSKSKTERLCVLNILQALRDKGFKDIKDVPSAAPGSKIYKLWNEKTVFAAVVGNNMEELKIIGSHMDSPRLDLKPNPLYQDSNLAMLQSHYYGGIKKYQWVNTPLALHGVVFLKDGTRVVLSIGEQPGEPCFIITDLLPHLAQEQMEKTGSKIIKGEDLNIIAGSIPFSNEKTKDQVKLNVLRLLNEKYGIIEDDFCFAEIEFVPAAKPVEIGFDRSLIASYGHDDRSCVYSSLQAILELSNPHNTAVAMFVDKEETGSKGNTGADGLMLYNFIEDYRALAGISTSGFKMLEKAKAISADVSAAKDPSFDEVFDDDNVSYPGFGVTIDKYNGSKGKAGTNDTNAEFMNEIRGLLVKNDIPWQIGELGKIDMGGGGTIAVFLTGYGMDCVDAGPCVLGMHAPCEVLSKLDIYSTYRLYKAFFSE